MRVRCGKSISRHFRVHDSLKQGGALSPRLFHVYINDLFVELYDSKIGVSIGNTLINHYADDICVRSWCIVTCQNYIYVKKMVGYIILLSMLPKQCVFLENNQSNLVIA